STTADGSLTASPEKPCGITASRSTHCGIRSDGSAARPGILGEDVAQQRARQSGIGTLVRGNARIYAMRPALIEDDTELTWADLERRTNRLARTLRSQGIGKGDRVALLLNDGIQFIE